MEEHHSSPAAVPAGHRKTQRAQAYSGVAILVLCLAVGILLLAAGEDPYIPAWLWLLLFLGCLVSALLAVGATMRRSAQLVLYGVAIFSSWAVVLVMPNQGMLAVLLIVVAAVGNYVLPLKAVSCVIVLNCVVIMVHLWALGAAPVEYLSSTVFYLILHVAAVLSTYAQARESRLRGELEEKTTELETALVLLEDSAKTAERLRISRQLHDLIGHQLTVLNLELEAAKHREGEQSRQHIDQAAAVAKELLTDVRTTVGEMREAGPGDLLAALRRIASAVQSLDIWVDVAEEVEVDEQQAEALLRAGQEIITNTVKHAEAHQLKLTVERDSSGVKLTGTNDGVAPRRVVPGHGLQGLRERVELLGGQLSIRPRPHFTVTIELPLGAAEEAPRRAAQGSSAQGRPDQGSSAQGRPAQGRPDQSAAGKA